MVTGRVSALLCVVTQQHRPCRRRPPRDAPLLLKMPLRLGRFARGERRRRRSLREGVAGGAGDLAPPVTPPPRDDDDGRGDGWGDDGWTPKGRRP